MRSDATGVDVDMRAVRPDVAAIEAALRQLSPRAERLLRMRFSIGKAGPRPNTALSTIPPQRRLQLEASAFRRLRLNAIARPQH